jgi:hypothetical protein
MTIEVRCPGCGRMLRVAEENAGKQLRCPDCQQICTAPLASASAAGPAEAAAWHMRTPDGQIFGPVTWSQVNQWVSEGRITADCRLASSVSGPWRSAAESFPALRPTAAQSEKPAAPVVHAWVSGDTATDAPWNSSPVLPVGPPPGTADTTVERRFVRPHRGGLILVLGILGIAVNCPIFCFMAWVMGSGDLAEMRAGRMDQSGEGITQVGQVLGMILSLFWIVGGVAVVLLVLFAAVAGQ